MTGTTVEHDIGRAISPENTQSKQNKHDKEAES